MANLQCPNCRNISFNLKEVCFSRSNYKKYSLICNFCGKHLGITNFRKTRQNDFMKRENAVVTHTESVYEENENKGKRPKQKTRPRQKKYAAKKSP